MKSFNQFLQESYLSEEEVQGRLLNRRNQAYSDINNPNSGNRGYSTDPTPTPASRRLPAGAPEGPRTSPGQMDIPEPKTTKVPGSDVRGETGKLALRPKSGALANTQKSSTSVVDTKVEPVKVSDVTKSQDKLPSARTGGDIVKRPTSTPSAPVGTKSNPERINPTPTKSTSNNKQAFKPKTIDVASSTSASASGGNPPGLSSNSSTNARRAAAEAKKAKASAGSGPSGKVTPMPGSSSTGKPPKTPEAPKVPGKFGKVGKLLGPASAALDTVLSTADERSKGSGWARSLAKGATVAAGGLLGGTAGAIGGGGLLSAATGTAGALAGGAAAEKAFDTVAGANAKQRKAIATANRNSQAGGALKGVGGKTSFDTKKNTITSGGKTAQLGKTSVVTNPKTGKQEVGNLAYKDGKAVYKRSDTKSLAQTSSNPLERIGRSLFAGAYKQSDAANAAKKLATARQSDAARNKALGVKFGPGK
jgi:hypothetical protein